MTSSHKSYMIPKYQNPGKSSLDSQSIFDKEIFTLRELCFEIRKINNPILNNITDFYLLFSSGTLDRKLLAKVQCNSGLIYKNITLNKKIYFRIILQIFDMEFNKIIVRIKTEPKKYDVSISWTEFESKIEGYTKNDLKSFIEQNQHISHKIYVEDLFSRNSQYDD